MRNWMTHSLPYGKCGKAQRKRKPLTKVSDFLKKILYIALMLDPNRQQKRVFYEVFFPLVLLFFFSLLCAAYNGAKYAQISSGLSAS